MIETAADEQDLARALDSVANGQVGGSTSIQSDTSNTGADAELPPIVMPSPPVVPTSQPEQVFPEITTTHESMSQSSVSPFNPAQEAVVEPTPVLTNAPVVNSPDNDSSTVDSNDNVVTGPLANIKKDALDELRPLVDKLNVSSQEKFDTYLLLIRSTDDSSLVAPAHEAAKAITDEARRAEALLEIIKEIDYLSRKK